MGKLSSTGVQELAHAAKADGLSHPEMVELASLGSVLLESAPAIVTRTC